MYLDLDGMLLRYLEYKFRAVPKSLFLKKQLWLMAEDILVSKVPLLLYYTSSIKKKKWWIALQFIGANQKASLSASISLGSPSNELYPSIKGSELEDL